MKNFLILTSVLTVLFVAIIDTKARIEELDDIAATTPSQVEMKSDMNKSSGEGVMQKFESMQPPGAQNSVDQKVDSLRDQNAITGPNSRKNFQPLSPHSPTQMP